MSNRQRKMLRQSERKARRRRQSERRLSDAFVLVDSTIGRDRFHEMMMSDESKALLDALTALIVRWRADNPKVELAWKPRPPPGGAYVIGPLGHRPAQAFLAANAAAFSLLDYLDRETGGRALTLQAVIALTWAHEMPPPPSMAHLVPQKPLVESTAMRHVRECETGAVDAHVIPPSPCPGCGAGMDAATASIGEVAPEPGDPGVCVLCGTLSILDERLLKRRMTDAELAAYEPEQRRELEEVSAIYRARALARGRKREVAQA